MRKSDEVSTGSDLELLPFLRALVDTASVTKAGHSLGMSQPAASRATARLRKRFNDPLIVRAGSGWTLTPLALELAAPTRRALAAAASVFESVEFDPLNATRRFRIASTDYGVTAVLLKATAAIANLAPGVGVVVDPWSDETIQKLERGELDAALYADEEIPPDFRYRPLFEDGYALVCRRGHPVLKVIGGGDARSTLRAAQRWPHFAPRYPLGRGFQTDNVYARLSLPSPNFVLESPFFLSGISAVLLGDVVAVIPQRATRIGPALAGLVIRPLRDPALRFRYRIIWHERAHRDPGVRWLRETVANIVC